jgi:hypothetical protein
MGLSLGSLRLVLGRQLGMHPARKSPLYLGRKEEAAVETYGIWTQRSQLDLFIIHSGHVPIMI